MGSLRNCDIRGSGAFLFTRFLGGVILLPALGLLAINLRLEYLGETRLILELKSGEEKPGLTLRFLLFFFFVSVLIFLANSTNDLPSVFTVFSLPRSSKICA